MLGTASGCATIDYDGGRYSRAPVYEGARPNQRPVMVVQVLRGDTLESVSDRFNVSEDAIIEANNLQPPYRLRPGQALRLPPKSSSGMHVVASGDTVNSIARSYGVSADAIIDANRLSSPNAIYPGERLRIPGGGQRQFTHADRTERAERVPQAVTRTDLAPPPARAEVDAAPEPVGQDPRLAGARYYNAALPRPKPGPTGEGGPEYSSARAVQPTDTRDEAYQAPRRAPAKAQVQTQAADDDDDDVDDEAFDSPRRRQAKQERQVASADPSDEAFDARRGKPVAPNSNVRASSRFVWPVNGQVISAFGKRTSGVHNDGINIAAEPGSSVKAADGGVVVYAGNELAGYGNLLLIRHSNGFVTAYAHNKKLLVSKGDNVRQGQSIALVGSTGDVDRPQLHFEIRKGDRAVDPSRYLERSNASL